MTIPLASARVDAASIVAGLTVWAAGFPADEAAIELLSAVAQAVPAVLDPSPSADVSWLLPCPRPGVWCLDGPSLAEAVDLFPARLRPVILIVAGLAADGALVEVGVTLAAVPAEWLGPVFAALAHAAGFPLLRPLAPAPDTPALLPLDGAA